MGRITKFAAMEENEKIDYLFSLIDSDGGGTIDAKELAAVMRKNEDLSLADSIENSIDMVATFDTSGDGELDLEEFRSYVTAMVGELGVKSSSEFTEPLVVQILLGDKNDDDEEGLSGEDITEKVMARQALFEVLADDRAKALFQQFETSEGQANFKDVATGLYRMARHVDESTRETMELLLMMERNDTRTLNYEQFGRLVIAIASASKTDVNFFLDDFSAAMDDDGSVGTDSAMGILFSCDTSTVDDGGASEQEIDALSYRRLKKLFRLWDVDGDGDITLSELTAGLKSFKRAAGIKGDAKREAKALLGFDIDGDMQLDPREFARAMTHYAKAYGINLHELIDFMCVSSANRKSQDSEWEDDGFGEVQVNSGWTKF
jgi:Ca2+-binding EF-hand superfamily protein